MRAPKPPPFPVGTRLRYVGVHNWRAETGEVLLAPGLEVTIVRVGEGRRGTGEEVDVGDGETAIDETIDGRSVYELPIGGRLQPRAIVFGQRRDWDVLA